MSIFLIINTKNNFLKKKKNKLSKIFQKFFERICLKTHIKNKMIGIISLKVNYQKIKSLKKNLII